MQHYPVLLAQSIELLNIKVNGIYIDGTFGRGGHTHAILQHLGLDGRLIAFDKDMEAVKFAQDNIDDKRFIIIHDNFALFDQHLNKLGIQYIDGIILDLGVSTAQLLTPERGFSFRLEHELDMRMDNTSGITVRQWLSNVSESELSRILWSYGEERFAKVIARNIIKKRQESEIKTTTQLADIISQSRKWSNKHPATKSFQALRIFINNELDNLELFLHKVTQYLNLHARLVIISFHSLEDRIVKQSFNHLATQEVLPKWINQIQAVPKYKIITKKLRANLTEIKENVKSRSAILRCLERIQL